MKIAEIMTAQVETLPPAASVEEAARLMCDADVGMIPIVLGGSVLGVLTDRDIVMRAVADGVSMTGTKVRDVLTPGVVNCFEDDEVDTAAQLMADHRIRRIVVLTRDHRLAGILSLADIAAHTSKASKVFESVSRPNPWRASRRSSFPAESEPIADEAESSLRGAGVSETGESIPTGRSRLDALVRDELSAVEIYNQALRKVGFLTPGGAELQRIEREHAEALQLLRERLARRGQETPRGSGLRGAWSKAMEGTAKIFGSKAAVRVLRAEERHGLHDYEDALKDAALDAEVKELIRTKLLPRTRAHLPVLDRVLEAVR